MTLCVLGPFTVFAPSDQAFAAVPQEILQKLQSDKALLQKVLKYHVVSGMHYADEANNELIVPSLVPGLNIRVNIYQGGQASCFKHQWFLWVFFLPKEKSFKRFIWFL